MVPHSTQLGIHKTVEDSLREAVDSLGLCTPPEMPPFPASKICSGRGITSSVNACNEGDHGICNRMISHHHLGVNKGGISKHKQRRYPKGIVSDVISVSEENFAKAVFHYTGQLPCPQATAATSASRTWKDVGDLRSRLPRLTIPNASSSENPKSPSTPHSVASTLTWDSTSFPSTPITSINNPSTLTSPITSQSYQNNASTSAAPSPRQGSLFPSTIFHGNSKHVDMPRSASAPCLDSLEVDKQGDQFEDTSHIVAYYEKLLFSDCDDESIKNPLMTWSAITGD